jgi:hypothetical protein
VIDAVHSRLPPEYVNGGEGGEKTIVFDLLLAPLYIPMERGWG